VTEQPDYVEYESVRLGTDGASEMDGNRRLVHIPWADVVGLEIVHGSAAERPLVSLILAALLAALSLVGPVMLVGALLGRGRVDIKFVTTIAFLFPAIWLFDLVLRRRWFLKVHMKKGSRKLIFAKTSDPVALQQFLLSAKERFGYFQDAAFPRGDVG
jgi:hypothetical protein